MIGKVGITAGMLYRTDETSVSKPMVNGNVLNTIEDLNPSGVRQKKTLAPEECQTCKNRRYQDGSSDPGVSFKSPTKMSPGQAASAVYAHEREHYTREAAKAKDEGREVVSNDIQVHTSVCPECGKTYVSGGTTRTTTRKAQKQTSFAQQFFEQTVGLYKTGRVADVKA